MALKIWLPLNGTLENKGISQLPAFSINNFVLNNNGKIGKCYTGKAEIHYPNDFLNNEWSIATWIKADEWGQYNDIILCKNINDSENSQFYFSVLNGSQLNIGINGSSSTATYKYTFTIGEWHHVAATYDGLNYCMYINGNLVKQGTCTSVKPSGTLNLGFGTRSSNVEGTATYSVIGTKYWNDFRIYDNCLSPKEVKEISQGLVIHYKLDDNIQTLNNCYSYPTFNTSVGNGGWNHWGRSGHVGNQGQNTDKTYIYNKQNTYSHWVSNGSTATGEYLVYKFPAFDGGYRSLQAIIKEEESRPITEEICFPAWNARNGGTANYMWTSIISLGDGFYLCKCEGISQDGSDDLVGIYVKPGYKIYISEAYLENDREMCSEILFPRNYIIDSSGYGNDGTIVGTVTIETDTSRYSISTKNTAQHLSKTEINFPISKGLTFAFWVKINTWGTQNSGLFCTSNIDGYPTDFNQTAMNQRDSGIDLRVYDGGTYRLKVSPSSGVWHHCAFTHDGINAKYYEDGVLKDTTAVAGSLIDFKYLYIGWSYAGGVNRQTLANWNDFRMYCTALSAEDIADLYHTSANIDNLCGLHGFEFVENDEKDSIYKNGIISNGKNINYLVNNFSETNTMTDWTFGGTSPSISNGVVTLTGTSPAVTSKTFTVNPDDIIVIEIGVQLTQTSTATSGPGIYLGSKYGQSTSFFGYNFTTNKWVLKSTNNTNPYFISSYNSTNYYHCKTYLLGSNKTIDDIPDAKATNTRELSAIKLNSDTTTNIRSGYNINTEMIIKLSDFKIYNLNQHGISQVDDSAKTGYGYLQYNDFIEK